MPAYHRRHVADPQAYELSTLTGTQVLLLVASETGHVYTFSTQKLKPLITADHGSAPCLFLHVDTRRAQAAVCVHIVRYHV